MAVDDREHLSLKNRTGDAHYLDRVIAGKFDLWRFLFNIADTHRD
jgi:hypothetical protein